MAPVTKIRDTTKDYVNNDRLYAEIKTYVYACRIVKAEGRWPQDRPQLSNYVGHCIKEIATRFSYRPNFIGYSYRDDMVSDAIMACIGNAHYFDPDKYFKPFAYFTKCCYHEFIARIAKEKRQEYVRYSATANQMMQDELLSSDENYSGGYQVDLNTDYYTKLAAQFEKKPPVKIGPLDKFVETSNEEVGIPV